MLYLRLAWRSFLRHKRRSIITAIAIAFGLSLMLCFVGISTDSHAQMIDLGIRMGSGHVLVQGKGYQESQTLDQLVEQPGKIISVAKTLPEVKVVIPRVFAGGLLAAGSRSAAVMVAGVDPDIEPRVSELADAKNRVAGEYLRPRAQLPFAKQPADIYLGAELAAQLKVEVDDRVVLTVTPRGSARPKSAAFFVRGTFRSGLDEVDKGLAQIPVREAQSLLSLGAGLSQIALMLDSVDSTSRVSAQLKGQLDETVEVLPWMVALRELHEAIVLDDLSLYLFMMIIFVIVAIGIFNTILTSITERTREMGVMMAIGTSRWRLFGLVMTEAGILALMASAAGVLIGFGLHLTVAHYGIDIAAMAGGDYEIAGIAFGGKIYSRLDVAEIIKWAVAVMFIVLFSALLPAMRISALKPVEAMRHV